MRYRNAFFESFGITLPNPTIYDVMIISKTVNPMPWFRFDKYRDWYNAGDLTYDDAEADDKFVNGYYTTGAARCHFTADFMDFSFKNLDADGKYIGEEGERLYSDEHVEAVILMCNLNCTLPARVGRPRVLTLALQGRPSYAVCDASLLKTHERF